MLLSKRGLLLPAKAHRHLKTVYKSLTQVFRREVFNLGNSAKHTESVFRQLVLRLAGKRLKILSSKVGKQ